jgi:hypothetical protein
MRELLLEQLYPCNYMVTNTFPMIDVLQSIFGKQDIPSN